MFLFGVFDAEDAASPVVFHRLTGRLYEAAICSECPCRWEVVHAVVVDDHGQQYLVDWRDFVPANDAAAALKEIVGNNGL